MVFISVMHEEQKQILIEYERLKTKMITVQVYFTNP